MLNQPAQDAFEIAIHEIGKGPDAMAGDLVYVNYKGTFPGGEVFDTNMKDGGVPFSFTLGAGEVIKGWEIGVPGMKPGAKRSLTIPYPLAYGEEGNPPVIPPKATLLFDIEMLYVLKQGEEEKVVFDPDSEKEGTGAEVKEGDTVSLHYNGTLVNGKKFDSSRDRNTPFSFKVGGKQVISGFEEMVKGMKVGGKRKAFLPPKRAYGPNGRPPVIPPNSVLVFEIELLEIK